ncbi:hypothetical protein ACFLR3_00680 [Campylobacterota bacterium]
MKTLISLLTLGFTLFAADALTIGTHLGTLKNYKYENQHKYPMQIPTTTKLLIVSFEKDTGALVNDYLDTKKSSYIVDHNAIFIADINRMPSIITTMFALPKMQKYKHPIYLHYEDQFENFVPHEEEKLTLLRVKDEKVESISYISTLDELKAAIEK